MTVVQARVETVLRSFLRGTGTQVRPQHPRPRSATYGTTASIRRGCGEGEGVPGALKVLTAITDGAMSSLVPVNVMKGIVAIAGYLICE